ncbi:MAG TPA: branched-chain amino acid transaminase [Candidatus Dormibacteraeota bacterium]|nr:branched-chain amino acid transaminase [Candidatus Dormibacteraeota bacterium]
MNPANTWMNGRVTPWAESQVHVASDAMLRGASVFEGIRAYRSAGGDDLLLFRLEEHFQRLFGGSMRVLRMRIRHSVEELTGGIIDLLHANEVRDDAHIRVVAYFDVLDDLVAGGSAGAAEEDPTGVYMLAFPKAPNPRLKTGVRCNVSAWRRPSDNSISPRVKASANYLNSRLASVDAKLKGFDIPVMLNERGQVSEGPGQNIFLVRRGAVVTPRLTDNILEGITRDTVLGVARELGLSVEEREVDFTELYVAEELFFAGTNMEVMPIAEIDSYRVGEGQIGRVTERIQERYFELVRGGAPSDWLTSVYRSRITV